jgi:hypothetical protein
VLLTVATALACVSPAAAQTSGHETFSGLIVTSGASGDRVVLGSVVTGRGVLRGVGRIVEVQNLPGDPDNVSRDDLVFRGGAIHIVSVTLDFEFSVDPRTCTFEADLTQTGSAVGGTGRFAAASGSFTGSVTARGLLARDADGSCSQDRVPLAEVDTVSSTGTLTY